MKHSARASLAAGLALLLLLGSCSASTDNGQNSAPAVSDDSSVAASVSPDAAEGSGEENGEPLSDAGTTDGEEDNSPDAAADEEPAVAEEPAAPTPEEALAIAMGYIGRPVAELISVIGEPGEKDYAKSCMGPGEDGNLYYDGFIVYTYLEDGEETIQDVE